MKIRLPMLLVFFVIAGLLGYWLAGTAVPKPVAKAPQAEEVQKPKQTVMLDDEAPKLRSGEREPSFKSDEEAANAGALQNQRVLVFKDQATLEAFLKRAGDKVKVMGRLDALNALRVVFGSLENLGSLLDGNEQASLVFPVNVPGIPQGGVQDGAVGLAAGLLDWLGITGDHSTWGTGVKVAILDTGVVSSPAFVGSIFSFNLVDLPSDPSLQNGHGTAVASMIIGQHQLTPGVAPGTTIYSYRIADDAGQSDSFLIAQGIVAAVDAGVDLINISLGGFGDSLVVRNALEYASDRGVLIVAAAGNNGMDQVAKPAAYEGVIAVGAVDASGNHLDFSNTGSQIDVAAPGYQINAAFTNNQAASVSGTSFSAPIVTGVIAAVMSFPGNENLTAQQAVNVAFSYLNEAGSEGKDYATGAGLPDLGRVLNGTTPGIYDAAVASQQQLAPSSQYPNGQLEVLVQNRGTEPLVNTSVSISSTSGVIKSNITNLGVGQVKTITIPIQSSASSLQFNSKVTLSGGVLDAKPSNDNRSTTYVPTGSK